MQRYINGSKTDFDIIVKAWKKAMISYFYQHLQDLNTAEDLAQEVFIRIYKTHQYNAQGQFSAWIYRIAHNLLLDHYRRLKTKPRPLEFTAKNARQLKTHAADTPLLSQEERQNIYQLLQELPEQDRELLILSQIQRLTYQEIATMMESNVPSIKGKIYRSMQKFIRLSRRSANA